MWDTPLTHVPVLSLLVAACMSDPPFFVCFLDPSVTRYDQFNRASSEGRFVWCLHGCVSFPSNIRSAVMLMPVYLCLASAPKKQSSEKVQGFNSVTSLAQVPKGEPFTSTTGLRWTPPRLPASPLWSSLYCLVSDANPWSLIERH